VLKHVRQAQVRVPRRDIGVLHWSKAEFTAFDAGRR